MSKEAKTKKSEYLVEVNDLKQYFPIKVGVMKTIPLKAVDGVSLPSSPVKLWEWWENPAAARQR